MQPENRFYQNKFELSFKRAAGVSQMDVDVVYKFLKMSSFQSPPPTNLAWQ